MVMDLCDNRPWHFLRCRFSVLFGWTLAYHFLGCVHRKERPHDKTKYVTAKTKYLTAKANTHGKTKAILLLLWSIWFSRDVCCFCREVFGFAVRYFGLPWGFCFCREVFCFCRKVFGFAVTVMGHHTKQYRLASFSTCNSRLNTSLR